MLSNGAVIAILVVTLVIILLVGAFVISASEKSKEKEELEKIKNDRKKREENKKKAIKQCLKNLDNMTIEIKSLPLKTRKDFDIICDKLSEYVYKCKSLKNIGKEFLESFYLQEGYMMLLNAVKECKNKYLWNMTDYEVEMKWNLILLNSKNYK